MAEGARRERRTQEERSATTRARLLDATIDCLVDYGYAGTTVARVAERAQVTRGAQVHHFPTKEDLVLSAVRHLNEIRLRDNVEQLNGLKAGRGFADGLLDVLWQMHRGPVFVATAEVWLAARTNAQLGAHIGEVEEAVNAEVADLGGPRKGVPSGDPQMRDAVFTAMDAMRGLVMSSWHLPEADVEARWQRLRKHLRTLLLDAG